MSADNVTDDEIAWNEIRERVKEAIVEGVRATARRFFGGDVVIEPDAVAAAVDRYIAEHKGLRN